MCRVLIYISCMYRSVNLCRRIKNEQAVVELLCSLTIPRSFITYCLKDFLHYRWVLYVYKIHSSHKYAYITEVLNKNVILTLPLIIVLLYLILIFLYGVCNNRKIRKFLVQRNGCGCAWVPAAVPGCGCAGAASTRRTRCAPAWCVGVAPWAAAAARPTRSAALCTSSWENITTRCDSAPAVPPRLSGTFPPPTMPLFRSRC